ncbi:MAG: DNA-binding transcriptional regulator BolA [Gammaproteobacteria bacterium]|nr:DNA-binding transcriptional regulator BolA [Gammaproteobacteria bacterium]
MPMRAQLERKLRKSLNPVHLEVINESHMHNVPEGSESHFKVVIVAEAFENQSRVARHRLVNDSVAAELQAGIHAFSINAMTPPEWLDKGGRATESPPCLGGSKAERF